MTDFQHMLVGYTIVMVLWHVFIKHYFITEKDKQRWEEILNKFF